ncbi:MAG: PLP-dependent aminotransferase family protein [Acidobacteriota bacterium]|nr:PLP-dependent aminotransferase family protein [Acidobacteriota bacterium]
MRAQDLHLQLDPDCTDPLYLQVARRLEDAIQGGRILPGVALPGVRELAKRLGVHRNTVLAALSELQAQGWVEARERAGVFVKGQRPLPDGELPDGGPPTTPGFDLPSRFPPMTDPVPQEMDLSEPRADVRLAPTEAMARAYPRAMRLKAPELLGVEEYKGQRRLRQALTAHLGEQRGLSVDPERILVTRGTGMALNLVAQALSGPEGVDGAMEDPGDPVVRGLLRGFPGLRLHGLPVDEGGLKTDPLQALLDRVPLKFILLSPQCQLPTGVALAGPRRAKLLDLAEARRVALIELDPEYDYHFGPGLPPRPLAAEDSSGQVIYIGSLSRVLAPGLHSAYLTAPGLLVDRLAKIRQRMDWQGDRVLDWALSELFLDGDFDRHLRKLRKAGQERRDALVEALEEFCGDGLEIRPPQVGMGLWVTGKGPLADPNAFESWIRACRDLGLKLRQGSAFDHLGQSRAATRIAFTAFEPEELKGAATRMGQALSRV